MYSSLFFCFIAIGKEKKKKVEKNQKKKQEVEASQSLPYVVP
jgi:hypothetical protein